LGDQDLGKGVSHSSTLGYNRAIRSTCWLVSKFEDEELLPAAMLLFVQAIASRGSAKELGKLHGSAGPRTFKGGNCEKRLELSIESSNQIKGNKEISKWMGSECNYH